MNRVIRAVFFWAAGLAACLADEPGNETRVLPPGMRLEPLPLRVTEPGENAGTPVRIQLGRLLFFDPILSASKDVACATCHHPALGWADGRATPLGVGGAGLGPARVQTQANHFPVLPRNSLSILNAVYNGLVSDAKLDPKAAPMFWDSRASSLEAQVFTPMRTREEMRGDLCAESEAVPRAVRRVKSIGEYRRLFAMAFPKAGDEPVTAENLAASIAAFERSLVAANTLYDRFLRGEATALNALQQRGLKVFQDAGCTQCHGGPMLSDFKLHFIGVTDGTKDGQREFRTPTLRNLRRTAPYMHNGSLATLEDVLVFYDQLSDAVSETLDGGDASAQPPLDPLLKQLSLRPEDFPALLAFFDALDDPQYDQSVPDRVPSGLAVPQP
ncbi:MAG TPA: cytochrome c peroxidase [Verrucomicrobiaceae bacterium]